MKDLKPNMKELKSPAENAGISVCTLLELIIPGNPVALARARKGINKNFYTPQKSEDAKTLIAYKAKSKFKRQLYSGAVNISLAFFLKAPNELIKKFALIPEHLEAFPVVTKPDLDNLIKLVLDALTGVVWVDDKQICSITSEKYYSLEPRTEIKIYGADHE